MSGNELFRGMLWESKRFVMITQIVDGLADQGFHLTRGHAKQGGSGGVMDTHQVTLIFERPGIVYDEGQQANNAATSFTDEQRQELFDLFFPSLCYKGELYGNDPIKRVRVPHISLKLGPSFRPKGDEPDLLIEDNDLLLKEGRWAKNVTFWDVFADFPMVRVSLNILPAHAHLIPEWLQRRERVERTEAVDAIREAAGKL